jgi:hypothetical protein
MRRSMDPAFLEGIANREDVRPLIGGIGPVKLGQLLADPQNFAFECDEGGFIVQRLFAGRYECHTIFVPGKGGRAAIRLMREAQEFMFLQTPCDELVTKVPHENAPADGLARMGGFVQLWENEATSYRNLTLDTWVRTCSTLSERGHAFHDQLEAAKVAAGSTLPIHPEDEAHDRYVGTAVAMITSGNVGKGIDTYNRWAVFAGYAPAALVSVNPVVVDIVDAVVTLRDGQMEVLKCR